MTGRCGRGLALAGCYAAAMILYHFAVSPFARRVRLMLAHKGLAVELRDARADPAHLAELRRLNPMHTVPVLVDGERVVVDSAPIGQYLERKHPERPLWPAGLAGVVGHEICALSDSVLQILIDLGLRYHSLHGHASFPQVRELLIGRAQGTLNHLASMVESHGAGPLCGADWSAAEMALYTTVSWLEGLPARAASVEGARQLVSLGWALPPALSRWADQHRQRPDVLALG